MKIKCPKKLALHEDIEWLLNEADIAPDCPEGPGNRRKALGDIICGFKVGCTMAWRETAANMRQGGKTAANMPQGHCGICLARRRG